MTGPRWRWTLGILWLVSVLVLTLRPSPSELRPTGLAAFLCWICGGRGTADALLNVALFLPGGALLGGRYGGVARATVAGASLATGIEVLQLVLPGRHPTLGDVIWNAAGAAAGAWAVAASARWLGDEARRRDWPGRAAAIVAGGWVALAGWLVAPSSTGETYYGQLTAASSIVPRYPGTLIVGHVDGVPVPSSPFGNEALAEQRLARDWSVDAMIVKSAPPGVVSPILSVHDARRREVLALSVHRDDLVLIERTRAKALLLDQPDLRLTGALAHLVSGDTVVLGARRRGVDRCISVQHVEACGLGLTPGRTWSLLLYPEGLSEEARRVLDALWLLVLVLPVGLLSVRPSRLLAHGALAALLIAASVAMTRLLTPPWWEFIGAALGLVGGWVAVGGLSGEQESSAPAARS